MKIVKKKIKGVYEITLNPLKDERGFFMRTYDINRFRDIGITCTWVQENHSFSMKKGIIRGLHFQFPPYVEAKLVRVLRGAVYDVFVDLRKNSPTFGQWDGVELSEINKKMIFIPRGFAHGFCTLTDTSEVLYKVDNFYNLEAEDGIIWNDKQINIDWPVDNPILSDKDAKLSSLKYFKEERGRIDIA